MRILVLNRILPFPPIGGGDLRTYHLVRALARCHEVTVVGFACDEARVSPPFPVRTFDHPWEWPPLYRDMKSGELGVWEQAYERLTGESEEPWSASHLQSAGMEELLRRVGREGFDLVLIEHSNMARFLPALPTDVPRILDLVDLHALMAERAAITGGEEARREAERTRRFERQAALKCALCLVTSEHEAMAARRLLGIEHIRVVPNGVDTHIFVPAEDLPTEGNLLFTGKMNYAPNGEAACYFAREVLPLVRLQMPSARLHIVGAEPGEEVKALACDDVVVHGFVPDVRPYFREAAVVVVPLLRGGGTRLKILEAAACAKAVVSTTLGAEGLGLRPGTNIVLADSAETFAAEVARLLGDPARCRRMGRAARAAALSYEWDGIGEHLCGIVEELVQLARGTLACASALGPPPHNPGQSFAERVWLDFPKA
jgi:glycosyltransferase involved in cell wall biosynthesis